MTKRLKAHLDELKVLKKAKPSLRKAIIKSGDSDLICCLSECCHNILNGNIKLSAKGKNSLHKHRKHLRDLASKKLSLRKKRNILVQKGGFLPALLAPILSVAASLIGGLIK